MNFSDPVCFGPVQAIPLLFAVAPCSAMLTLIEGLASMLPCERLANDGVCFPLAGGDCLCAWSDALMLLDGDGNSIDAWRLSDWNRDEEAAASVLQELRAMLVNAQCATRIAA